MADDQEAGDAVLNMDTSGAQGDTNRDADNEEDTKVQELKNQVLSNPQVLAALQDKLDSLVGVKSGYIENLPPAVKRRVKALKNNQVEIIKLESKFYEEVHALECKYAKLYEKLYDKRKEIVTGAIEPTDSECEWESSDEEDDDDDEAGGDSKEVNALAKEVRNKITVVDEEPSKGIPEFWPTLLKNVDGISEQIQDHDEPILQQLEDIRVVFHESPQMGFTLEFHFTPNEFFNNKILTKTYSMKSEPEEGDPFSFEGPEIISSKGCAIDWKKGKDVTVRTLKKKQKHKGRGQTRVVTQTVANESFFNFFKPPEVPEDDAELDEATEDALNTDFEVGHMIRERLIPRAVLYFTGEAIEDFEEEDEGDDDDNEDLDDEDDEDPDFEPPKGESPAECKNQ